jgi:uncharacterized protein
MPDYQEYIQAWQERFEYEAFQAAERKKKALEAAKKMAGLLLKKYMVSAVYVFGSVVLPDKPFTEASDIDIAVSGLAVSDFFKAWRELESLTDFRVDLLELEHCPADFRPIILSQGRCYTANDPAISKAWPGDRI